MTIATQVFLFPGQKAAGGLFAARAARTTRGLMARHWSWLFLLCAMLTCAHASAANSGALYEAVVPVAGYDAAARDQALSAALSEVLVRVSGNQKAPQQPALARVVQNAQRLVQRFSYENAPAPAAEPAPPPAPATPANNPDTVTAAVITAQAPPAPTLMLHAIFDAPGIDRVLNAAGFNVWVNRPQTVLWLALDTGTEQTLTGADAPAPLGPLLKTATDRRGLPLLYPLLDIEDQQALQFSDVVNGAADRMRDAAQRYQPDAVLAGYVHTSAPDQYEARWTLYHQDGASNWQAQGSLQQVIDAGIDGAADQLSQRAPAVIKSDAGGVLLHVSGITDLSRYADVEHYLTGMPVIAHVQTQTVEATAVTFALQLSGTRQALQETLARGALLAPEAGAPADPVLRYRIAQ
jgi:uncharacterized protein